MWELDHKESWAPKNWCFWTAVLEKTLESPLDCREIQPVYPKIIQSWAFIGMTDAEAESPILWSPDVKNWLTRKDPDAGKDWRQEEKQTIEDEMVGWHHWLDGHEFEQAPGVGDGQGGLVCCSPWGCKELDMTDWLSLHYSVQFSHSVVSDSLRPHGLQHARLSCPSPTPRACSNSCLLSQWCHPPSYPLSSPSHPAFSLSQHQGLFQWVSSSHQLAKVLELQPQHQSLKWIFRADFLEDWLVWSPWSPRDSQESSPIPQFKSISFLVLSFLYGPALNIHTWLWKNHSFD